MDCETNDCRKEKRGCKGCYYDKKVKKVEGITGTIIDNQEEKEYLHIIEELKPKEELHRYGFHTIIKYPDNEDLMNKINEIIREVNKMMRGR